MDNRPIGVFDSGLGGLTAVRVLRRLMPNESIVYFGDTGRMPYGGRSVSQIRQIARQNIEYIRSFDVKAILAACGTISSNAGDILDAVPVKTVGVLLPGVGELASSGKKRLGIIATETSIKSGAFQRALAEKRPDADIMAVACPKFVPLIESGHYLPSDPLVKEAVETSLASLRDFGVEALLLGCTHYGLIEDAIADFLPETELIAASAAAARELCSYMEAEDQKGTGGTELYRTSGDTEAFMALAPIMLGYELKSTVEHLDPFPTEV